MHYEELHTHRWAWVFAAAFERLQEAFNTENEDRKKALMCQVVHGDLEKEIPEEVMPGVLMWLPYYRGVQGEMITRFQSIRNGYEGPINEKEIDKQSLESHRMFLDDVNALCAQKGFLSPNQVTQLGDGGAIENYRIPGNWVEIYQSLRERTLAALEKSELTIDILQEWMLNVLRGLITYNYWLARQAFLSFQIIDAIGLPGFQKLIDDTKEDFGWRVSREFFYHTMQRAGVDGQELYKMGRYAMFCDQIMVSGDREKPEGVIKARESILKNCELYQGIRTPAEYAGKSLDLIGPIVCDYCENHGKKNAAIFTPPDQHPNYNRIESFGYGDTRCVFHSDFTEGDEDEMDRFMEAQEIVFGEEEYESWD